MHGADQRGAIPHMANFGMIVINDSVNGAKQTSENDDENLQLVGYFVMKRYSMTLEQYVCNKEDLDPLTTIDIITQLIGAYEIIHQCDRTYNDLKL
jgi:hypothetical protein